MSITVHVRLGDALDAEHAGDPLACPIGCALARQYPGAAFIVSNDQVFTLIEGQPGPVYDLPQQAQEALAMFDAYRAGHVCEEHIQRIAAGVSVTLKPAPREIVPFMRRDKWKSVHSSKN